MSRPFIFRVLLARSYPEWLLAAFAVWFAIWAIDPPHPSDFILEHVLTVLFVGLLVWSCRRFRLSNISYTCMFIFMCLHVIGAHYTYSEAPYDRWFGTLAGWLGAGDFSLDRALGFERNQFDRLVHFTFGLTFAYPVREIFVRIVRVRGFWGYYLPLDVMMSFSMLYELLEWVIALTAGAVGESYLGAQGDKWDAQKDMALATLGGLLAMTLTGLINWRYDRDFALEWAESLKAADTKPLGEVKLAKMLKK